MDKSKRSLGRDAFEDSNEAGGSKSLKKLIRGSGPKNQPEAREVEVRVKLTPSNIKHLDNLIAELKKQGKGSFTRSELIRVAITLLGSSDF
ncbi:MAG: hypothetical protein GTO51_01290 [Candidatus Latescibacteria bacterium]|nr:hypothetical protein [Candidatus Latescibacterota bacterium]NIM21634.1 hypothetical protein [Candidatus Latescibacterota bacterium]NIM64613.1 hypothetical protein [Candidatus Latescibacterota bacterium]NIO01128.1 hypothetical protein [Candidatus Latescibacterota bacterium]NIO27521.1 hypothetical protein [Candidatus Latescibacterota bacterium]